MIWELLWFNKFHSIAFQIHYNFLCLSVKIYFLLAITSPRLLSEQCNYQGKNLPLLV